jgi:hypothetical protein
MNLYEIHISVKFKNALEELKWLVFCKDNNYKNIRVLNDRGTHEIQNMISLFCNKNNDKDAIDYANEINNYIKKNMFEVSRVKVEAMIINDNYDKLLLENNNKNLYWEFHLKIIIKKYEELKKLFLWKKNNDKNIGLSISSFGDTKYPIITIRHHNGTSDDILNYKKFIISDLENNGFKISDKIQRELTVYDTYPEEDDGWISKL